mmetsp:Transcript_28568/g.62136  ORF Transcript_28568/g.62136 Transcript_28568/m.62136 type:complete len:923 (-) Transcript_28568:57-2825(-)
MRTLQAGQLVEVKEDGARGQLLSWDSSRQEWSLATFQATTRYAKEPDLRALETADIGSLGFDVALGPMSDHEVMGAELSENLTSKGFAVCQLFLSSSDLDDMVGAADRMASEGSFSRLAQELEPGYLGKGTGKTLALDQEIPETAAAVRDTALGVAEDCIAMLGTILRPCVFKDFGFELSSRSTSMLSMPFDGDESDYEPPDLGNEDAAAYLMMLWRAKLMVLFNAGPGTSTLTLMSKNITDKNHPQVKLAPGMMAVFVMDRYKFDYVPDGKALMVSTFFLDSPKEYAIDNIYGDMSTLVSSMAGPPPPQKDQIPIVSIGCRYAMGADAPWKAWLGYSKAGKDAQVKHPTSRWDVDYYYEEDADQISGKSYTCHGGFCDGIELFDCRFFDISPNEARGMDPSQRQVLEVSYIALAGAGFTRKQLQSKPANIGAFVGLDKNEWQALPKEAAGGFGASNTANAITSNRFNYCLNLKGASMTIDTACSSSLVAQHTAKLYLLHKHYDPCEAVITCGVNLSISPFTYIGCCAAGMHSHKGRCFTYNATADGYARGEATAATAAKLKDFDIEAGDLSLIAGSQVNQDGRSASLTAPNGPAQERCNLAVFKEANLKPPDIDTTECHGTGTSLGDPIEIGAFRKVMASVPREEPVVITTSKSNLGHCEGSAGISGLIKCALLCMYSEGTPNVHLNSLNPHLDMAGFPGIITTEGCTFRADASYNGVLSFGFGGTNACATLWGTNIMTSRAMRSKDMVSHMLKRVYDAPAQEVTITGDDWEEWEIDFPVRDPKPTDKWDVELDEDGMVLYVKQDPQPQDVGSDYFVSGSFNGWGHEPMMADSGLPGLFVAEVTLGPSGHEEFVVNADQDAGLSFYPAQPFCVQKNSEVLGPGKADKDHSWSIRGSEGERYRVEFFLGKARTASVSWIREQ